jgi:hypothetical protein
MRLVVRPVTDSFLTRHLEQKFKFPALPVFGRGGTGDGGGIRVVPTAGDEINPEGTRFELGACPESNVSRELSPLTYSTNPLSPSVVFVYDRGNAYCNDVELRT